MKELIINLYEQGYPIWRIAEETKKSEFYVVRTLQQEGLMRAS